MVTRWTLSHRKEKELYLRAIDLLNDKFKAKGVTPTAGVELEFHVFDKKGSGWFIFKPDNYTFLKRLKDTLNTELAGLKNAVAFSDKDPVGKAYREDRNKFEVTTSPTFANRTVEVAELVRKYANSYILKAADKIDESTPALDANGKPIRGQYTFKLSRNAIRGKRYVPGLHTSLGFLIGNLDAFHGDSPDDSDRMRYNRLAEAMADVTPSLMLLFAPKPLSYRRYGLDRDADTNPALHQVMYRYKDKCGLRFEGILNRTPDSRNVSRISYRIENRIPGADTPIYKAILGNMLAAYVAMEKTVETDADGKVQRDLQQRMKYKPLHYIAQGKPIVTDMRDAINDFKDGKKLWELLDQLSPGEKVGTKIYEHELDRARVIMQASQRSKHVVTQGR